MTTRDDGGPAFPFFCAYPDGFEKNDGMTLRDYFAAKAMQALFTEAQIVLIEYTVPKAYEIADAMLAERNK